MKSAIKKHSMKIAGHKTSFSLEDEFWASLKNIAEERHQSLSSLVAQINEGKDFANLSSAIRMFVLRYYHDKLDWRELITLPTAPHLAPVDLLTD
jgi:predicted DNA-binding ribbon-helix-helix protein